MKPAVMEARTVCSRLAAQSQQTMRGRVHSVFDHAVNVECGGRLLSMVQRPRGLVPYGCTVDASATFPDMGIAQGMEAMAADGMLSFDGGLSVDLCKGTRIDLSVESIAADHMTGSPAFHSEQVLRLLRAEGDTDGMSVLVTNAGTNVYADLIRPRLPALFDAVAAGDMAAAVGAVTRVAGCGIGLTPGSDDLLTGYFIAIRVLCRIKRMRDVRALLPEVAMAAARKTNRISGAFLQNSGDGLASEDYLSLVRHAFFSADTEAVIQAAKRVAQFGSTSGRDILTGFVLAIQHHDGGKNSGKTGNPEKRVL